MAELDEIIQAVMANSPQMKLAAKQRAGRKDVTDILNYGPDWESYAKNFQHNLNEQFPLDLSTPEARLRLATSGAMSFGPNAVKQKGGMWHPDAAETLTVPMVHRLDDQISQMTQQANDRMAAGTVNDAQLIQMDKGVEELYKKRDEFKRMSKNYLNKYAGTAEDPLRDLQIPHINDADVSWERLTDSIIGSREAKNYLTPSARGPNTNRPDWLSDKVPMDEKIWDINRNSPSVAPNGLGASASMTSLEAYLAHVGDHMRTVAPEELPRYDLVRAVRETAAKDEEFARKMLKSTKGNSIGTTVHKEYPDGFKWVEVGKHEGPLPDGWTVQEASDGGHWKILKDGKTIPDEMGGNPMEDFSNRYRSKEAAEDGARNEIGKHALNHEGNTMGHCVGSYCDLVSSDQTKIFSLRDSKGASHVTVEVRPPDPRMAENSPDNLKHHPKFSEEWADIDADKGHGGFGARYLAWQRKVTQSSEYQDWIHQQPHDIAQIKGKQNRAPVKEYQPYVQDLIKTGNWGRVDDLHNSGLFKYGKEYLTHPEARDKAIANIERRLAEVERGASSKDYDTTRSHATSYNKDQLLFNLRNLKESTGNVESAIHFGVGLWPGL